MNEPKKLKPPVDWDDLYQGRFMKGGQIAPDQKVILTIAEIDVELLMADDDTEKPKGVISFKETPMKLPLNKTNGICLRAMFGRDVRTWAGKQIVLYRGDWKGQPAVRIFGSPHLTENMQVEVKLPRRRAQQVTLYAPKKTAAQQQPTQEKKGEP